MAAVRIWWDKDLEGYYMTMPFHKVFVDTLKQVVPGSDRGYNPAAKTWSFTEKWLAPVTQLVTKIFGTPPQVLTRAEAEKASAPSVGVNSKLDTVVLKFFQLLPYEAAQRAYKAAAMTLHPDRGGKMEDMSELNALWTRIEKEVYKR